jgi:outer membrane biosynthesis protein TonB
MSDRRYRRLLRSHLPIALACALAVSVGGCSTWRQWAQFGSLKDSQAACQSDAWPTKVMASVHRETSSSTYDEGAKDDSGYVADYTLDDMPEERPREPFQETFEEQPVEEQAEPMGPPAPPEVKLSEIEPQPSPPEVPPQAPPATAEQQTAPQVLPPAVEPQPAPEAQPLTPEADTDTDIAVVLPPGPATPSRPTPSPEVIEVCGADDEACQDQVMAMLSDPLHKWIRTEPTPDEQRTGARALAYRVLTPVLACDDLRQGVRETEAVVADMEAAEPDAEQAGTGKSLEWLRLLNRAVKLELRAEIERRC